jgi:feruloyl esterase
MHRRYPRAIDRVRNRSTARVLLTAAAVALVLTQASTIAGIAGGRQDAPSGACDRLRSLAAPDTTVTLAQEVAAGSFAAPGPTGQGVDVRVPFCRLVASLRPSADSDITVEVWLPLRGWNGKLQAVGNGAFNGTISYSAMAAALGRGYATTSTDTGHVGGGAKWALGHPEKVIDFGWRAVHEMTVLAKRAVAAHYGTGPRHAYWNGCSAGGRQALQEAQRFPDDFDGIIAGAPGFDWTGRAAQAVRLAKLLEADASARLDAAARQLLHDRVLAECDALDGVKDGVLERPQQCQVDPGVLECRSGSGSSCLTPAQVATAREIYASPVNAKTKRPIPGLMRGSEPGWTDLGWTASARATGLDQFRFLVFRDPAWTIARFDFERDLALAEESDANTINALNPDLRRFMARGGKLIQYHGWSDPQIAPGASPQYYDRVSDLAGDAAVRQSYRLFMAPGMGHCGGGAGPNTFDMMSALEQWAEQNKAPDRIVASRSESGRVVRTRPLCPYPQVAAYKGSGSTDEESSFVCK